MLRPPDLVRFHHSTYRSLLFLGLAITAMLLPLTASFAGTICGTVRDATTSAPIAHAGIFLRKPAGEYTGIYGSSEPNGSYCILWVPPDTYDLEIQVNHYVVAYVRGVVVSGAVTEVPIDVSLVRFELAPPTPNPARLCVRFSWTMPGAGWARVAVFDVRGRLVSLWANGHLSSGPHSIDWDLRDPSATRVSAGVYYVRLDDGRTHRIRRFVCVP